MSVRSIREESHRQMTEVFAERLGVPYVAQYERLTDSIKVSLGKHSTRISGSALEDRPTEAMTYVRGFLQWLRDR